MKGRVRDVWRDTVFACRQHKGILFQERIDKLISASRELVFVRAAVLMGANALLHRQAICRSARSRIDLGPRVGTTLCDHPVVVDAGGSPSLKSLPSHRRIQQLPDETLQLG